jgi:hypothetical protein
MTQRHSPPYLAAGWLLAVTATVVAACGQGGSPTGPTPPPVAAAPPPPAGASSTVLRRADFQSANGYRTEGSAVITMSGSTYVLDLQDDFRTSNSGILEVRLCRDPRCGPNDLNLGAIRAFSGRQSYLLPDDAAGFRYVVIWCRAVSLPFGFGDLR